MTPPLVTFENESVALLVVAGELDLGTTPALRVEILTAFQSHIRHLIINLQDVSLLR
jgi:anti-anti-sigma factor